MCIFFILALGLGRHVVEHSWKMTDFLVHADNFSLTLPTCAVKVGKIEANHLRKVAKGDLSL